MQLIDNIGGHVQREPVPAESHPSILIDLSCLQAPAKTLRRARSDSPGQGKVNCGTTTSIQEETASYKDGRRRSFADKRLTRQGRFPESELIHAIEVP